MKKILPVLFLLLFKPLFGDMLPGFHFPGLCWNATHVVVVKDIDQRKRFEVLESWTGDLKTGEVIRVPYLDDFKYSNAKSEQELFPGDENDLSLPGTTSFNRVLLFLRKDEQGKWQSAYFSTGELKKYSEKPNSIPVDFDREYMKISILLIGDTMNYAFSQFMNPGPRLLMPFDETEKEMKTTVIQINAAKKRFEKNAHIVNLAARADSLKPYLLNSRFYDMRSDIAPVLRSCGPEGARAVEEVLKGDSMPGLHTGILQLLAFNFGEEICPHLIRMLNDDRLYWEKQAGKKIPESRMPGTYNSNPAYEKYMNHNGRTYYITAYLANRKCTEGREALAAFCAFWFAHPEFDPTGKDQVSSTLQPFRK